MTNLACGTGVGGACNCASRTPIQPVSVLKAPILPTRTKQRWYLIFVQGPFHDGGKFLQH